MKIKQLYAAATILLTATTTQALLGPIPIYLNTEYRTSSPTIGSISSTLSFNSYDIKASGANSFIEFLSTVPSVGLVNPTGNVPAIFLRGNEARHTLVIVDGVSVNDISSPDGAPGHGLKVIPLNDIEKIDIVKGAGSVLYGSSAIGGVISVTTKKGSGKSNVVVSAKFGTNNTKTNTISASNGDREGYLRLTHSTYSTDGINAKVSDTSEEKDGIESKSTQMKIGNENFSISYLQSNNKYDYDGCWAANPNDCVGDRRLNKLNLEANVQVTENWKTNFSISRANTEVDTYNGGVVSIYSSDDYVSENLSVTNDIQLGGALVNAGLTSIKDENLTDKVKRSSKELFVNWQKALDTVDVNAGLRHINDHDFGKHVVYDLGFGKYLSDSVKVTANYNTAFSAPSLYQTSFASNPAGLKPETSKNINLGVNSQTPWGETDVSVYKNVVSDMVIYNSGVYDSSWNVISPAFYSNTDKLTNIGLDISTNTEIFGYDVSISENYVKSRLNDSSSQSLRRPESTTSVVVSKNYGNLNSRLQVTKKSSTIDYGNVELEGYTLVDLHTDYEISNSATLSLGVKNVTDKKYTATNGYNQAGRTTELGLTYEF